MYIRVQFSRSVVSDSLQPHGLQHARPPCPSPTPGIYPDSCPSSRWCHPAISSSVIPFSSCLCSFPASGSFQMSQLFTIRVHTCIKFENYSSQILLCFEEQNTSLFCKLTNYMCTTANCEFQSFQYVSLDLCLCHITGSHQFLFYHNKSNMITLNIEKFTSIYNSKNVSCFTCA